MATLKNGRDRFALRASRRYGARVRKVQTMLPRLAIGVLFCLLAFDAAWALSMPSLWMLPAMLVGWYCADAMSGIVHMYMDYRPCPPEIGLDRLFHYEGSRESDDYLALRDAAFAQIGPFERLVYDFKNHHPRPDALGRRSMEVQVGPTALFTTLPFMIAANLAFLLLPPPGWLLAGMVAFAVGASFAQYFHGTLHRADVPLAIRGMRRLRLLMRPQDHVLHHETLTRDFSTINGWSNPPLNLGFRLLRRIGRLRDDGLVPR